VKCYVNVVLSNSFISFSSHSQRAKRALESRSRSENVSIWVNWWSNVRASLLARYQSKACDTAVLMSWTTLRNIVPLKTTISLPKCPLVGKKKKVI